jgi:hypothetical protein
MPWLGAAEYGEQSCVSLFFRCCWTVKEITCAAGLGENRVLLRILESNVHGKNLVLHGFERIMYVQLLLPPANVCFLVLVEKRVWMENKCCSLPWKVGDGKNLVLQETCKARATASLERSVLHLLGKKTALPLCKESCILISTQVTCVLLFGLKEIVPLLDRFAWLATCLHGTKIIKIAQPNPGASMHVFSFKRKEIFSPILDKVLFSPNLLRSFQILGTIWPHCEK